VGLKLHGTHQLLVYADDVNLLGDNIGSRKKNRETSIDVSNDVGLEVNTEKTKYMLLSHQGNSGRNLDTKIDKKCLGNTAQFKYLGTTATNLFYSGGNYEETVFGQCLLPFSPEPFVFSSAI
jgi:hypothetical protein